MAHTDLPPARSFPAHTTAPPATAAALPPPGLPLALPPATLPAAPTHPAPTVPCSAAAPLLAPPARAAPAHSQPGLLAHPNSAARISQTPTDRNRSRSPPALRATLPQHTSRAPSAAASPHSDVRWPLLSVGPSNRRCRSHTPDFRSPPPLANSRFLLHPTSLLQSQSPGSRHCCPGAPASLPASARPSRPHPQS